MAWYKELGFEENPLSTNPSEHLKDLMGLQEIIDEVAYRVEAGNMVFIEGPDGSGKSSVLRSIVKRFSGEKKVIYIDAAKIQKTINIQKVMQERYGLFGRILNIIPENMILLMDNVQLLSRRNSERIKYYFDNNYILSVIFTGKNYKSAGLPQSIRDRIGGRVISLKQITARQASEAVKRRLNNTVTFQTRTIQRIHSKTKVNMKRFLEMCEILLENAIEAGKDVISEEEVNKVLKR